MPDFRQKNLPPATACYLLTLSPDIRMSYCLPPCRPLNSVNSKLPSHYKQTVISFIQCFRNAHGGRSRVPNKASLTTLHHGVLPSLHCMHHCLLAPVLDGPNGRRRPSMPGYNNSADRGLSAGVQQSRYA